jgi:aldose 1-epimerase
VAERAKDRMSMTSTLHPQLGWPSLSNLRIAYQLGEGGPTVRRTAINARPQPALTAPPAHPYLTLGTPSIDGLGPRDPSTRWTTIGTWDMPADDQPVAGLSVDPMTGAPNALQPRDGLLTLRPAGWPASAWGISAHPPAGSNRQ